MKRVLLVRHGETFQNRERIVQGADPTQGRLTERGVRQAALLGRALAAREFDLVYCSPLERAVLTLAQLLLARGGKRTLPLLFARELEEIDLGNLHGKSHADWREAMAGSDPMAYRAPGGENWLDVQKRVGAFFRETILPAPEREILVVAHGGVNRGILADLLGITMGEAWLGPGIGAPQDNACVNTLEFNGSGELAAVVVNDTSHLLPEFAEAGPGQRWVPDERRWELLERPNRGGG